MKIALITIRTLMGLMFLFASISYFLKLFPQPPMEGDVKTFNEGLLASRYIIPMVKVIELLCGIAFVTGRFVPLAAVVIFPITVNILLYHAILGPEGLPVAVPLFLGNLFLAYYYTEKYKPMLAAK